MGVEIARLRLRGPPEAAVQTRFLIEDGVRTSWPDEERLVLIRRVALSQVRAGDRPAARQAAFRQAYDQATGDRRHGSDSGAASANCVWFESRAEAWRLLLRALLAGRRPDAWFWRLAVPEWHGEAAEPWLADQLEAALAGRGTIDAVALVEAVEAAGAGALLFAAVERLAGAPAATQRPARAASTPASSDPSAPGAPADAAREQAAGQLAELVARLPPRLVRSIEALAARIGPHSPAAHRLVERMLLRASPSLRLAPPQLAERVRAYAEALAAGAPPSELPPHTAAPGTRMANPQAPEVAIRSGPEVRQPEQKPRPAAPRPQAQPQDEALRRAPPAPEPLVLRSGEVATRAAGLWLVIPSLIRLGFREWLIDHPRIAAADGGRQLLRTLGRRYRLAADDAALVPLGEPADPLGFETAWRVALDRYLRRRARIRLAEVILRPGWIALTEERVVVRFAPDAADIRLRRRALDVDPGWTDWLGLSVRYRYAERSEP